MPLALLMIFGFWVWWPLGLLVLAFMIGGWIWWPLGLAALAFIIGSGRMGCWNHHGMSRWDNKMDRWDHKMQRMQEKMERLRSKFGSDWGGGGDWFGGRPSSGNAAFDEYRRDTLRRLEDEQREFKEFLERLRFAKDRAEFDQFMSERRNHPQDSGAAPRAQPQPQN